MNSIAVISPTVSERTGQDKGKVNPKILSRLKKEFGEKTPIADIRDERVMKLRDTFLFDEGSSYDPSSLLGKGWIEDRVIDSNNRIYGKVRAFWLGGKDDEQIVTFDGDSMDRVSLCSTHYGWLFGFSKTQEITMRRDGEVSASIY